MRGAGHVYEARNETTARQRLRRRDRQPTLRQLADQLSELHVAYLGHSPHCQVSSALSSSSLHVSRASRTAAAATDGEYPLRASMELSLR